MLRCWITVLCCILGFGYAAAGTLFNRRQSSETEPVPWNFRMMIKYDVYAWECTPSNNNPMEKNTNVSCLLDGRWSLNQLTFQLTAIPTTGITSIDGTYTMKDGEQRSVQFRPNSQWAVTVPVDPNWQPGLWNINDKLSFQYGGSTYTFYFGYGPTPHCPRC